MDTKLRFGGMLGWWLGWVVDPVGFWSFPWLEEKHQWKPSGRENFGWKTPWLGQSASGASHLQYPQVSLWWFRPRFRKGKKKKKTLLNYCFLEMRRPIQAGGRCCRQRFKTRKWTDWRTCSTERHPREPRVLQTSAWASQVKSSGWFGFQRVRACVLHIE